MDQSQAPCIELSMNAEERQRTESTASNTSTTSDQPLLPDVAFGPSFIKLGSPRPGRENQPLLGGGMDFDFTFNHWPGE